MLAIGFLFGLGFDTATEVALFGISSAQAANGISFSSIMCSRLCSLPACRSSIRPMGC